LVDEQTRTESFTRIYRDQSFEGASQTLFAG